LRGSANARWILLEGASTISPLAVVRLIDEAMARNRVPFARTGRGPVVIRSTAAKKRGARKRGAEQRPRRRPAGRETLK